MASHRMYVAVVLSAMRFQLVRYVLCELSIISSNVSGGTPAIDYTFTIAKGNSSLPVLCHTMN